MIGNAGAGRVQRRRTRTRRWARSRRSTPTAAPGSVGDDDLASYVAASSSAADGLHVQRSSFNAQTVDGPQTLETVTGHARRVERRRDRDRRPPRLAPHRRACGPVRHRDAARARPGRSPARPSSARSCSRRRAASAGAAGAAQLARTLPEPVDAVIVLGDLAGTARSHTDRRAVVGLDAASRRRCCATRSPSALQRRPGCAPAGPAWAASSLTWRSRWRSEQGPFGATGEPAVLLSLSGERAPGADEPVEPGPDHRVRASRAADDQRARRRPRRCPRRPRTCCWQGKLIPGVGGPPVRAGADRAGPGCDGRRARPRAPARPPCRRAGSLWVLAALLPFVAGRAGGARAAPRRG